MILNLSLLFLLVSATVNARPSYVKLLPNGANVPNPCLSNSIYNAIGHLDPTGSGGDAALNRFGHGFKANSRTWNMVLCQLDSDGDGFTNGEELGDPNCLWTEGQPDPTGVNISHPGICTPIDSAPCKARNPCQVASLPCQTH
ncbi:hypothetical protein Ciccas_002008 [Cichlidogyrus casuarinus]|uniref:Temptin Cys/Cys disulfide domain-containing protein n=1 Tax=Cichlidogyrus casuarinus TaxID=1844966 RepID=A0ABD2QLM4_9PLAT